ncbi:MAG: metallophosphoesterase [Anaerolineaceae bacterium]
MDQFIRRKSFPGTSGNPFDTFLHKTADFDRTPALLFLVILILLAAIPAIWDWPKSLAVFLCILSDWLLFSLLPRFGKSFGPVKTSILLLAISRVLLMMLPLWLALALNLAGSTLVFWGTWIEPHHIKLTHQNLTTAKLPAGFNLRLLHLGDLHIERLTHREMQLNRMIKDLSPDLILFSGDFLNLSFLNDPKALADLHTVIDQWSAPLGVYAVTGSPAVDLPDIVPDIIRGSRLHLLQNQTVKLDLPEADVRLTGITCSHRPHIDGPILEGLLDQSSEVFNILLYHTPDLAPLAGKLGVDLQLSGHTHGGQIRLPGFGALVTGSLQGKKYESGRYEIGGMVLYVTRGLGMEGLGAPRARLFCPPEAILWEISGSKS